MILVLNYFFDNTDIFSSLSEPHVFEQSLFLFAALFCTREYVVYSCKAFFSCGALPLLSLIRCHGWAGREL